MEKTKQIKVKCVSFPNSTFEFLTPRSLHTAKSPNCVGTSLQVVKFPTKQKPFDLYRPATGLSRVS
jgi:hypothetical protein